MNTHALHLPRLVLRVGALGNRRFGRPNGIDADSAQLEQAAAIRCREVLNAVREIVARIQAGERSAVFPELENGWSFFEKNLFGHLFGRSDWWQRRALAGKPASVFNSEPPLIQVLSGLAQGADRMILREALALNAIASASPLFEGLGVIVEEEGLPAPAPESLRECVSVGSIPQSTEPPDEPLPRPQARNRARVIHRRAAGFRAQSEALRHHSDILLAVWDADAEAKVGGTAESVSEALRARLPVLAVRFDSTGSVVADLLRCPEDLLEAVGTLGLAQLEPCLRQLLCFPDPSAESVHHGDRHYSSYHPRVAFHRFCGGLHVPVAWPARLWRWLRRAMESGYEPRPSPASGPTGAGTSPGRSSYEYHYGAARDRASVLSEAFGDAHRGGILWSYVLAAGAVLLALTGIYLHYLHAPPAALAVVASLELLTIAALWALAETATFEDWHEAYTDVRLLAEALRHMQYLVALGVHAPLPKLPPHLAGPAGDALPAAPDHDPRRLWTVWYFRALTRNAPLQITREPAPSLAEIRQTLLDRWVGHPDLPANRIVRGPQTEYHRRNRFVNRRFIHGLEHVSRYMFVVVFGAALLHLADTSIEARHPGSHPVVGSEGGVLFAICFWLGVGGPALLAAINGFLSQIEAVRLRQRSEGMALLLKERHRVLSALDLTTAPTSVEARWRLAAEAATTAGLMLDETADWALLYKSADIHAG